MRDATPQPPPARGSERAPGGNACPGVALCVRFARGRNIPPTGALSPPNQHITCAMAAATSSSQSTETQVLVLSKGDVWTMVKVNEDPSSLPASARVASARLYLPKAN